MIVVDVNLLLYSYDPDAEAHHEAKAWLETVLSGDETVAIPFMTIAAFLRIATNQELPYLRMRMEDAFAAVEAILESPNVRILHTDQAHWEALKRLLHDSGATGKMVSDAQFAAFAIQHRATLCSTDRHFSRFPGLRWVNPLRPQETRS